MTSCSLTFHRNLLLPSLQGVYKRMVRFKKINKKFISHLTRAKFTPSAAATVQVSHALPAVRFSCLLRGRVTSFQDGVAAVKGMQSFPAATPYWKLSPQQT